VNWKRLENTPPWEWPASAGAELTKVLSDRRQSESDRVLAADLAGNLVVMNDETAELLLAIVRATDEPDGVRAQAAISLGPALEEADMDGYEDDLSEPSISQPVFERIQETLRQVYGDESTPKLVRRRVLEASVRAAQEWHADAIRAAYSRGDEEWRLSAVFGMQYVRGFDKEILESLESGNDDIHYEAVRAAGAFSVDAAWPHVAALLDSEDTEKDLLLAAIEAAASIRPSEAGMALVDLSDSDDEEIAEAATEAMMMAEGELEGRDEDEEEDEDGDCPWR
jgi:hypothetical protein